MKLTTSAIYMALAASTLFITPAAEALLPPLYDSISAYKELLGSQELGKKLDESESIIDIEKTETGFLIITNKSTLVVDLAREPQNQPGPAKYRLEFHEKAPL